MCKRIKCVVQYKVGIKQLTAHIFVELADWIKITNNLNSIEFMIFLCIYVSEFAEYNM